MIGLFIFLLFLYFSFQSILSLFFYLYLWQIKEYRLDRLLCHFKTKSGKGQIINYLNILRWKGIARPMLTPKFLAVLFFSLFLDFKIWFFLLKHIPFNFSVRILIASFLLNILAPFISALSIFFFKPVTVLLKKAVVILAKRKITGFSRLLVVGITGSFGKSSTKEFLTAILSAKFKVCKTPKNWNTEIGVAKAILQFLKKKDQIFVVEMGAYKRGEIKAISNIVHPRFGVITGINAQHLALFGSIRNTMRAKYELIESLPKNGLAVFNGDNNYCLKLAEKTKIKKIIYSLKEVSDIKEKKNMVVFKINGYRFQLNLLAKFNVLNFLAAFHIARELGMTAAEIARAAKKIKPLEGTMDPFIGMKGAFFIDDTHNSNPDGFIEALSYLKKRRGRKVLISSGIIELGKAADRIHREIGRELSSICDLIIITKRDAAESIKKSGANFIVEENLEKILSVLKREVGKGDLVLLEGRLLKGLVKRLR